jgi:methylase of polypeptide subunit release factors
MQTNFDGLEISYDHRVLAPRPWTVMQSRWAAELVTTSHAEAPILELYAGVGHIGLAAARACRRPLVQVEVDPIACGFAVENAWRAGMAHCVSVRCAPVSEAVSPGEDFGVAIADPPYLRTDDVSMFPDDPVLAVDGGADGLCAARECLQVLADRLRSGTPVLLQLRGPDQVEQLANGLPHGLELVDARCDGADRAVALLTVVDRVDISDDVRTPLTLAGRS